MKKKSHVLFLQLQDLAVIPSIRDPQLNSAECVTEGHKPDIKATGQSDRIIAILCCSCLFSILSGPLLASYVMHYKKTQPENEKRRTIDILCGVLLVIFLSLFILSIILECECQNFILAIYPSIAVLGFVVGGCTYRSCPIKREDQTLVDVRWYAMPCFVACANLTVYHFCWLLIGIMLNPTWGLAVLLVVCLVIGVFTYTVFTFLSSDEHCCQSFFLCLAALLAVCFLIVVVILAGQSYYGRQTADEVLKDGVLYLISISFSWLYWKHHASRNSSPTSQGQLTPPDNSSGHRLLVVTSNTTMAEEST